MLTPRVLGTRLLCVVVASAMQDEEIDRWSEVTILVWPIQPKHWLTL
jgi:hypothetical protein